MTETAAPYGANDTANDIRNECLNIQTMLLHKNDRYGDSALNPVRVFSTADAIEQLRVRADDKISRIRNQVGDDYEDSLLDLIGYLILLRIARKRAGQDAAE
jgi:hypothetical protein